MAVAMVLPNKTASSIIAYAFLFSIPWMIVSLAVKQAERFKWYVLGGVWLLSIILGVLVPFKRYDK